MNMVVADAAHYVDALVALHQTQAKVLASAITAFDEEVIALGAKEVEMSFA